MSQNDHKGNPALGMSTVLERGRARKETSHHVRLFDMARGDSSAVFVSRIKLPKDSETCVKPAVSHGLTSEKNLLVGIEA
jgi:hypothetical protein